MSEVAKQDLLDKAKALLESISKLPRGVFHEDAESLTTQALALHGVDASIGTLTALMTVVDKLGTEEAAVVARRTLGDLEKSRDAAKKKDKTEEPDYVHK